MRQERPSERWVGVILAAGRGRRFGGSKQLAIWPGTGTPLVCAAFDAIAPLCARMVVVLGHDAGAVGAVLRARVFESVVADPDAPMFESVRAGLGAAAGPGVTGVVLQPADHPGVRPDTLRRLAIEAAARTHCAVMPEFEGRGGHPALIPVSLVPEILAYDGAGGLREYWNGNPGRVFRVQVEDPTVIRDVDEPGDVH